MLNELELKNSYSSLSPLKHALLTVTEFNTALCFTDCFTDIQFLFQSLNGGMVHFRLYYIIMLIMVCLHVCNYVIVIASHCFQVIMFHCHDL